VEKTKGQIEAEITEAVIRFEKEYMGRGPVEAKTYIVDDMVLVRLKGVLSRAEQQLATTGDDVARGRELIKQVRREALERGRMFLEQVVRDVVQQNVVSLHTDISTIKGERVIVFTLDSLPVLPSQTQDGSSAMQSQPTSSPTKIGLASRLSRSGTRRSSG
jgi:uncharacterized protein YbcI